MSPIETVRQIYAAFGRGDVPAILACLAEDVDWEYGQPPNPEIHLFHFNDAGLVQRFGHRADIWQHASAYLGT